MAEQNSVKRTLDIVKALEDHLEKSGSVMMRRGMKMVNGEEMGMLLKELEDRLPAGLSQAERVLADRDGTLQRAQDEAKKIVAEAKAAADRERAIANTDVANAQRQLFDLRNQMNSAHAEAEQRAKGLKQEAEQYANNVARRAADDANNVYTQAQAQAQAIIDQANREAAELVTQEQIYMRAQVEAERIRAEAEEEARNIRGNAFNYINTQLRALEEYVAALLSDVHREAEDFNSNR